MPQVEITVVVDLTEIPAAATHRVADATGTGGERYAVAGLTIDGELVRPFIYSRLPRALRVALAREAVAELEAEQ